MTAIAIPALAPVLKPSLPLFGAGFVVDEVDGVIVADALAGEEIEEEVEVEEALVVNSPGPTAPPIVVMFT